MMSTNIVECFDTIVFGANDHVGTVEVKSGEISTDLCTQLTNVTDCEKILTKDGFLFACEEVRRKVSGARQSTCATDCRGWNGGERRSECG